MRLMLAASEDGIRPVRIVSRLRQNGFVVFAFSNGITQNVFQNTARTNRFIGERVKEGVR